MKRINQLPQTSQLTTNQMNEIRGGKQIIDVVLKSNSNGTYYKITYSDGSYDVVWVTNYA